MAGVHGYDGELLIMITQNVLFIGRRRVKPDDHPSATFTPGPRSAAS